MAHELVERTVFEAAQEVRQSGRIRKTPVRRVLRIAFPFSR